MTSRKENSSAGIPPVVHMVALAEVCVDRKEFSTAMKHYFNALKILSVSSKFKSLKLSLKPKFSIAFQERCQELHSNHDYMRLFDLFRDFGELYPDCEVGINCMGSYLFRLGLVEEAACCFRKALRLEPNYLGARENLENIISHLVERWHFIMLNDCRRNTAFSNAITRAMTEGHSYVLDIGSGTGLLSMFAVMAGAESVHACEMSKSMYELSLDIVTANQMKNEINVIHKKSKELDVGRDIPRWVDLVVSETVDAGLLGESILESIHDAWERLLIPYEAGGRVIPGGATVYACAVESDSIRRQNRLLYPAFRHIDMDRVSIISDVGIDDVIPARLGHGKTDELDPYTTENLHSLPGGYKQITGIHKVMCINFNDREHVATLVRGVVSSPQSWPVTSRGRADALVVWFDLELDSEHVINTGPYSETCWEQAVHPVLIQHLKTKGKFGENFMVKPEDTLFVEYMVKSDCLRLRCIEIERAAVNTTSLDIDCITESMASITSSDTDETDETDEIPYKPAMDEFGRLDPDVYRMSDIAARVINSYAIQEKPPLVIQEYYTIDRRHLERINDMDFNSSFCNAIEPYCSQNLNFIISMQGLGILSLQALKMGARRVKSVEVTPKHKEIMDALAETNSVKNLKSDDFIHYRRVFAKKLYDSIVADGNKTPAEIKELFKNVPKSGHDVTRSREDISTGFVYGNTEYETYGQAYDVLVTDIVDECGALRQQILEDVALIRLTCLRPEGRVIPDQVLVYGVLVHSIALEETNRVVSDERTLGLNVARFMNDFAMSTHVDMNLLTLPHTKLSSPFTLLTLNLNEPTNEEEIPQYMEQCQKLTCDVIASGHVSAVVYWFDLTLNEKEKICTLDGRGHFRQAGMVFRKPIDVATGDKVELKVRLKNSCIDIKVAKC